MGLLGFDDDPQTRELARRKVLQLQRAWLRAHNVTRAQMQERLAQVEHLHESVGHDRGSEIEDRLHALRSNAQKAVELVGELEKSIKADIDRLTKKFSLSKG